MIPGLRRRIHDDRLKSSVAFVAGLLYLSGVATGQVPGGGQNGKSLKPAWQWALDERLANRFNVEAMKARAVAQAAEDQEVLAHFPMDKSLEHSSARVDTDTIDGKRNPELFLPTELFDALLNSSFSSDPREQLESRRYIEERSAALGFGRDCWSRIEKAAAPFLRLKREQERSGREKPARGVAPEDFGMDRQALLLCRARAEAIDAAEAEFGKEPLLRLLYEVVAPYIGITYVVKDGLSEHKNFVEGDADDESNVVPFEAPLVERVVPSLCKISRCSV
jgi:hypothetical protein